MGAFLQRFATRSYVRSMWAPKGRDWAATYMGLVYAGGSFGMMPEPIDP